VTSYRTKHNIAPQNITEHI